MSNDGQISPDPLADASGLLLPHYRTFSNLMQGFSQGYRRTYDESIRHDYENAQAMRRDIFVCGCMEERRLQVASLPWEVVRTDTDNPEAKSLAPILSKIIKKIPTFTDLTFSLGDAIWYGRQGAQFVIKPVEVGTKKFKAPVGWTPVLGDKIQFGLDDVPEILINPASASRYPERYVRRTETAPAVRLELPAWRRRFVIHQHHREDADYYAGEMAGRIQGVGVRDRIYWAWWMRDECLAWATDYMQKVGTQGLLIAYYDEGNAQQEQKARDMVRDASRTNAVVVARGKGDNPGPALEILTGATGGIDTLMRMIDTYWERHIERYIIGQTLSSKADGAGLGGSSVAELHADTKFRILKYDSHNMAETYTRDLVRPIQRMNFPESKGTYEFRFVLPDPEVSDKLEAIGKAIAWGVQVKVSEIRKLIGLSAPAPDDEVVGNPRAPTSSLEGRDNPSPVAGSSGNSDNGDKPGNPFLWHRADLIQYGLTGMHELHLADYDGGWVSWTLTGGPCKGQTVQKNASTGAIRDVEPAEPLRA